MSKPKSAWVDLAWSNGTKTPCMAWVFGQWCVHEIPFRFDEVYRVSHVPTGLSCHLFSDEMSLDDAIMVANLLNERFPECAENPFHENDDGFIIESAFAEALGNDWH